MAAEYGININVRTKDEKLKILQKNLTAADRAVASLQKKLEKEAPRLSNLCLIH